jgi:hypothetical protein
MKEEWYGAIYRRYLKKLAEFQHERPNRYSMLMSSFFVFCAYVCLPFPYARHSDYALQSSRS